MKLGTHLTGADKTAWPASKLRMSDPSLRPSPAPSCGMGFERAGRLARNAMRRSQDPPGRHTVTTITITITITIITITITSKC